MYRFLNFTTYRIFRSGYKIWMSALLLKWVVDLEGGGAQQARVHPLKFDVFGNPFCMRRQKIGSARESTNPPESFQGWAGHGPRPRGVDPGGGGGGIRPPMKILGANISFCPPPNNFANLKKYLMQEYARKMLYCKFEARRKFDIFLTPPPPPNLKYGSSPLPWLYKELWGLRSLVGAYLLRPPPPL